MDKTFRTWNSEQTLLLPPSPVDWLPVTHLVFFLLDMVAELDLCEIHINDWLPETDRYEQRWSAIRTLNPAKP